MFPTSYLTIDKIYTGLYKEQGSKFLSFMHPIQSEQEVKEFVKKYKKDYYDARHHCYAFIIGENYELMRGSDDGEPSNSAGIPILGQLRAAKITNVLIVVVRYFGGTKLGVSGLINAYKLAAQSAISEAIIITKQIQIYCFFTCNYLVLNQVMRFIKEFEAKIQNQEFTASEIYFKISLDKVLEINFKSSIALFVQFKNEN